MADGAAPVADGWRCPDCTYLNASNRPGCEMCSAHPPTDDPAAGSLLLYSQLLSALHQQPGVPPLQPLSDAIAIECPICLQPMEAGTDAGGGVRLAACLHEFCAECLRQTVRHSEEAEVRCPYVFKADEGGDEGGGGGGGGGRCEAHLLDIEVRALLGDAEYAQFAERSLRLAERKMGDSVHCLTANCAGWWVNDERVERTVCPVCGVDNCMRCENLHPGLTCAEHNELKTGPREQAMLDDLIGERVVMRCPKCRVMLAPKKLLQFCVVHSNSKKHYPTRLFHVCAQNLIQKNGGCDNMTCSVCSTHFVWRQS